MDSDRAQRFAQLLSKFVPEGLAERLEQGLLPGSSAPPGAVPTLAERREVTLLLADLSGLTELSERLDPDAVVAIVNRFFAVLTAVVGRWGGSVDKLLGDAAFIVFGAPRAVEDPAGRAVSAALELQERLHVLATMIAQEAHGTEIRATCAISRGLVVAGVVGSSSRCEYALIGDAVTAAERLQKACNPGDVVIDQAVGGALDADALGVVLQELPPLAAKGRREPLRPLRVKPVVEKVAPEPGLVGRRAELAVFDARLEKLDRGEGGALVLTGPAGVGKSRLLGALARRARGQGIPVVERAAFSEAPGAFLAALFAEADSEQGRALLAAGDTGALPVLTAEALAAVAGRRPFVVAVDDVAAIDSPSRAALTAAAPDIARRGGLLAAAARTVRGSAAGGAAGGAADPGAGSGADGAAAEYADGWAEVIPVGPLPPFDAKRLLTVLRPDFAQEPERLDAMVRDAGGLPRELLRLAGASGVEAGLARVDDLPAPGGALLAVLALLGSASAELLAEVAGVEAEAAAAALTAARADGLLARVGERVAFDDPALREAVAARLVGVERRRLSTRIAEALEANGAADEARMHRARGVDPMVAAEALAQIAGRLLALGQPAEALERAREGRDRAREAGQVKGAARLQILEGRALAAMGRQSPAISALMAAWSGGGAAESEQAEAGMELARLFSQNGRLELADEFLEKAAKRVGPQHGELRARLDNERGALAYERRNLERARVHWTEAAKLAEACGARALQGRCAMSLGIVLNAQGKREQALEAYGRAAPLLEGDASGKALLAHHVAISLAELGRSEEALETDAGALTHAEAASDIRLAASIRSHRSKLLAAAGRWADARAEAEEALTAFKRLNDTAGIGDAYRLIGVAVAGSGPAKVAETFLRRAVQVLTGAGVKRGAAEALVELARISSGQAARYYLEEARALFLQVGAADRASQIDAQLAAPTTAKD